MDRPQVVLGLSLLAVSVGTMAGSATIGSGTASYVLLAAAVVLGAYGVLVGFRRECILARIP